MRQDIAQRIAQRTRDEWSALLEGTDVCFAPVLTLQEAPTHAHALERQAFVEVDGFMQPSPAPRFERSIPEVPTPAPEVGEHTQAVLLEFGFTAQEVAALRAQGVTR